MKKIIWVNGCFDILHSGHIELLEYAKSLGDFLIVGLDSDERVRKLKGKHRPLIPLHDRKTIIESLKPVDHVVFFDSNKELEFLIQHNYIDTMVVGEEYKDKEVVGGQYALNIYYFKLKKGRSTTSIVNKVLQEYCKERYHDNS